MICKFIHPFYRLKPQITTILILPYQFRNKTLHFQSFVPKNHMPQPLPSKQQQKDLCGRNFRVQFLERLCSSDPNAQIRLSSETGRLFLEEQLKRKVSFLRLENGFCAEVAFMLTF
jgi:hypothetical protein